jgi:hypothetical protein
MPGKEIKGRSKIANYRHGGRTGLKEGMRSAKSKSKRKNPASFKSKWSSGPKPGTLEYFQLHTQKPKKDHHAFKKGGHVNTSRENRLEELGRVDAERAGTRQGKRNLKDEKRRIVRELKK